MIDKKGTSERGVFERPDGTYGIRYKDAQGRTRHKVGFKTKTEAKNERKRLVGLSRDGQATVALQYPTLKDYADEYLKTLVRGRLRDHQLYAGMWKREIGNLRLDAVTPPLLRTIRLKWANDRAAATVNRRLAWLRHLFNVAIKDGYELRNPVAAVGLLPENNMRKRFLRPDEEERLRAAFPERYWYAVEIAMHTTLRQSEQFNMRWPDVDFESGFITIPHTKPHRQKHVYMNERVRAILMELYQQSRQLPEVAPGYTWVFVGVQGNKLNVRSFLRNAWEPALVRASVEDFCWHDLRHTGATRMKAAGVDLQVIKEVLGHSDIRMTQRYSHIGNEALMDAMNRLVKPSGSGSATSDATSPENHP
ncbi:MAG: tyrosine-type recombinase/integrase [Candidatus Xenobia bacterium]